MPIFRKEQLNNNSQKIEMLDIIIVLWIFSSALLKSVLYFFNLESSSGQLAIVYIIVAAISAILCFKHFSRMLPVGFLAVILLFLIIGISFAITEVRFGDSDAKFLSEFKAFFAMALCTFLITLLVAWRKKNSINLNVIFAAIILLTFISFISLFNGDSITTGGYILDSSGLIYQNISFYSAYAFGLTLFYMSEMKRIKQISWLYRIVCLILLIIQTSTCFISGGRGGIVLIFVLFIASVIFNLGKKAYKIVIPVFAFIFIIRYTVPWLINLFGINIKGFTRIMTFLSGDLKNDGRFQLYSQSLSLFRESPVTGNGIGSIFNYLQSYSHNFVLDLLAETGVIGLLLFLILLIIYIKKNLFLFNQGSLFRFFTYIFVCGITLNMFSGYIWTNQLVWLPIVVVLTAHKSVDNIETSEIAASIESYIDNPDDSNSLEGDNNG